MSILQEGAALIGQPFDQLQRNAGMLRQNTFGNAIKFCAIINIRSGHCGMDCAFCAQSGHYSTEIEHYGMLENGALKKRIMDMAALPVAHIGLVSSGAALDGQDLDRLCEVVSTLPANIQRRICVSPGRLGNSAMNALRASGVRRYHHNLETCSSFYAQICTTQSWTQRAETVAKAASTGFEICCGGLFGMGETWEQRLQFAHELASLGVSRIPINFLHPQPGTPLGNRPSLDAEEALRIVAIFRHLLPEATLRICGGRLLTLGKRQNEMFASGANALMTGNYLTTKGSRIDRDIALLADLGLKLCGFPDLS